MKYPLLLVLMLLISCETKKETRVESFPTRFELSDGKETATYEEVLEFYIHLAREFPVINIQTIGETDSGRPLQMVTYNPEADFNFQKISQKKLIILINNGIHPGEPDGIDASMMLFRDLATNKITAPENTVLVAIPIYNVGGALNRNSFSRVNQNGPESYGFRGNARNYDLNRDFIKSDTKNARTFAGIFHTVNPDVFVDTHVSNGADYQYTLTQLSTQQDKLGEPLGSYLKERFMPGIQDSLSVLGWDLSPYVNVHGRPPDTGFVQFLDLPRYSTGYAALWNTLGIMLETHMLKPYEQRVRATYDFLLTLLRRSDADYENIRQLRKATAMAFQDKGYYPINWEVDSTRQSLISFKGFTADTIPSEITGQMRLKYRQEAPFTKEIPYYNHFVATDSVLVPEAYIVKKSWGGIMEFMDLNHIEYRTFEIDSSAMVESYRIENYQTGPASYEGHYPHHGTSISAVTDTLRIEAGDFMIRTNQPGIRYLLETLEPAASDSFFNWNFFDPILQRKEGFSAYVFEELAASLLKDNDSLRQAFETKREQDAAFSGNPYEQLEWIYARSPYFESSYLQYPVYRIPKIE